MSCNNCNSNCSCSDNCPNKTSDITLFDGTFNSIEVPCDASLNDVLALLEEYTNNLVVANVNVHPFVRINNDGGGSLTAQAEGGSGVYTYAWEIADNGQYITFAGATNVATVSITNVVTPPPDYTSGLVKVIVTDSDGRKCSDVFYYYEAT